MRDIRLCNSDGRHRETAQIKCFQKFIFRQIMEGHQILRPLHRLPETKLLLDFQLRIAYTGLRRVCVDIALVLYLGDALRRLFFFIVDKPSFSLRFFNIIFNASWRVWFKRRACVLSEGAGNCCKHQLLRLYHQPKKPEDPRYPLRCRYRPRDWLLRRLIWATDFLRITPVTS